MPHFILIISIVFCLSFYWFQLKQCYFVNSIAFISHILSLTFLFLSSSVNHLQFPYLHLTSSQISLIQSFLSKVSSLALFTITVYAHCLGPIIFLPEILSMTKCYHLDCMQSSVSKCQGPSVLFLHFKSDSIFDF